jgi:excisionase family DNA binding protein
VGGETVGMMALLETVVHESIAPCGSPASVEYEFLTVQEIARSVKLHPQTVRNRIAAGTLPAVRIGRCVRVRRADFDRFLEASRRSDGQAMTAALLRTAPQLRR